MFNFQIIYFKILSTVLTSDKFIEQFKQHFWLDLTILKLFSDLFCSRTFIWACWNIYLFADIYLFQTTFILFAEIYLNNLQLLFCSRNVYLILRNICLFAKSNLISGDIYFDHSQLYCSQWDLCCSLFILVCGVDKN